MYATTARRRGRVTTVEVDGPLDVIQAHDLRRCVAAALESGAHRIELDLSRVTGVDHEGVRGLKAACAAAIAARVPLVVVRCSRPFVSEVRLLHGHVGVETEPHL